jgi:hypothetical protein
MVRRRYSVPALGGLIVAIGLAIPASLENWSAPAVYGIVLVSIVTAAIMFVRLERLAAQDKGDC